MFKLVISDDEGKTTVVPLVRDEITIGRKEGNTIRLTDRNVSRRHARLRKEQDGFVLEDLGSYNGTKVNGEKIEGAVRLQPGDVVAIGDYELLFQDEDRVSAVPGAEGQAPLPPRLVMLTPPAPGAEYALTGERMRIGRAEDLDIWVNHRSISREHAVIERDGDAFRIRDEGSSNGVKVNGEKVTDRVLQPGDVVELGSVRFRFVGEGEEYVFDADATLAISPVSAADYAPARGGRGPMVVAGAIVALGLLAGGLILLAAGGEEPEEVDVVAVQPPGQGGAEAPAAAEPSGGQAPAEPSGTSKVAEAVSACREALQKGDAEAAVAAAGRALAVDEANAEAEACRREAEVLKADLGRFEEGKRLLASGDPAAAFFQFAELSADSPLRRSPEVREAERAYAEQQLEAAREALARGDQEAALGHVRSVLTVERPPRKVLEEAQRLERQLRARGRSGGRAGGGRPAGARGPRGSGQQVAQAAPERPRQPSAAPSGGRGRTGRPRVTQPTRPPPTQPAASADPDRWKKVQRCLISGDNACVIRLLEGRARSARELGALIDAYVRRGNMGKARRAARRYCSQYRTRFTSQYCKLADAR